MIDMYGKLGNVENAEIFFEHMRSFGITPDTVTYTSLLSVYNKYGLLKKAEALYEEMVSKVDLFPCRFFLYLVLDLSLV